MENKNFILYLFAALALSNNSIIASKANISNGNDHPTNTNKSEDYKNSGNDADKLQSKKDGTFGVEGEGKTQWGFASKNFSIKCNLENVESSFKKKVNDEKISGDVLSVEGNFMMSLFNNITYKRALAVTFGDDLNFGDKDKDYSIDLSDTEKLKKAVLAVLSWLLAAKSELSIYGYGITQRISPLSVKENAGYRVNLFSVKNVFNVLNRLSYTSSNPGCMDLLNVSIMRTDAYLKDKKGFSTVGGLCIDVFSVNKKFSNLLEIGFLIGTHYNLEKLWGLDQFLENAALQFSLNCTCKYIFMNLKLIGYRSSNSIMCKKDSSNIMPLNIYLDYTTKKNNSEKGFIVPVRIKLGSSILKGKRVAAFGRNSLICKDICLDIKSNVFYSKSLAVLFSYDLSLNFSLEKYIDFAVGICSNSKGLKLWGDKEEVKTMAKVDDSTAATYGDPSRWIYFPIPYLKIQINWLELRK